MTWKRILLSGILCLFLFGSFAETAFAQLGILPTTTIQTAEECKTKVFEFSAKTDEARAQNLDDLQNTLGCAIKFGYLKLWMVPFFIMFLLQFLVALAGMVCMLFIVIGGYHYVAGGLTDEKEKGKKTLMYAIAGFVVVLVSWIVINIIQTQLTK